jgi:hypothetical protein
LKDYKINHFGYGILMSTNSKTSKQMRCYFNHTIGLLQKDSADKPLYDYEGMIFDSLVTQTGDINNNKYLWVKKATGLGISEFMLRFMAWLCLKDNALSGLQNVYCHRAKDRFSYCFNT